MPVFHLRLNPSGRIRTWTDPAGSKARWDDYVDAYAKIVAASNEQAARQTATNGEHGNEPWWLDPAATDCLLIQEGADRIILIDSPTRGGWSGGDTIRPDPNYLEKK